MLGPDRTYRHIYILIKQESEAGTCQTATTVLLRSSFSSVTPTALRTPRAPLTNPPPAPQPRGPGRAGGFPPPRGEGAPARRRLRLARPLPPMPCPPRRAHLQRGRRRTAPRHHEVKRGEARRGDPPGPSGAARLAREECAEHAGAAASLSAPRAGAALGWGERGWGLRGKFL